jgi:hypothetical protein
VKSEPLTAVAVSVTGVPLSKGVVWVAHVGPQLMPGGVLVTVPLPLPALVRVRETGEGIKVAVTVVLAVRVTVQGPVPEHPPSFQPAKNEPTAAVAVSVTGVPLSKGVVWVAHVGPQLMPGGVLVTVPLPLPALVRVRETGEVTVT